MKTGSEVDRLFFLGETKEFSYWVKKGLLQNCVPSSLCSQNSFYFLLNHLQQLRASLCKPSGGSRLSPWWKRARYWASRIQTMKLIILSLSFYGLSMFAFPLYCKVWAHNRWIDNFTHTCRSILLGNPSISNFDAFSFFCYTLAGQTNPCV